MLVAYFRCLVCLHINCVAVLSLNIIVLLLYQHYVQYVLKHITKCNLHGTTLWAKWYVQLVGYVGGSHTQIANFTLISVKFSLIGLNVLWKIANIMWRYTCDYLAASKHSITKDFCSILESCDIDVAMDALPWLGQMIIFSAVSLVW